MKSKFDDKVSEDPSGELFKRFASEYSVVEIVVRHESFTVGKPGVATAIAGSVLPELVDAGTCPLKKDGKCHGCISFRGMRVKGGKVVSDTTYEGFCDSDRAKISAKPPELRKRFVGMTLIKLAKRDGLEEQEISRLDQMLSRFYAMDVPEGTVNGMAGFIFQRMAEKREGDIAADLLHDLYGVVNGSAMFEPRTAGAAHWLTS
jgi:hypothetical protein